MDRAPRTHVRALFSLVALASCFALCLAGCTPPWRQAYIRAEDAIKTGRYAEAATAFTESCDQDATASDACSRAKTLRRQVVEETLLTAKAACARDVIECLSAISDARRLVVREPELRAAVEELLDRASVAHIARCSALPAVSYDDVMVRARCLAIEEETIGTAAHQQRVREGLEVLARTLDVDDKAKSQPAPAEALVRAGLAHCYSPSASRGARMSRARSAVIERHHHDVDMSAVSGVRAEVRQAVCQQLASRMPVRCADSGSVKVAGALEVGRVQHTIQRTPKSVRYVDFVEEKPNPEYARTKVIVEQLGAELRQADRDVELARSDCSSAESALTSASYCYDCAERTTREQACSRKDALERSQRSVKSAFDDKERELRFMDKILRIEHTAVYDYIELQHVWEQPARVEAQCRLGSFAEPAFAANRAIRIGDVEHIGFRRAGLVEDPLMEPTGAELVQLAQETAKRELFEFTSRCLTSLSKDPTRCEGDLDCWIRQALYRGEDPATAVIASFSDAVDRSHPGLPRIACR